MLKKEKQEKLEQYEKHLWKTLLQSEISIDNALLTVCTGAIGFLALRPKLFSEKSIEEPGLFYVTISFFGLALILTIISRFFYRKGVATRLRRISKGKIYENQLKNLCENSASFLNYFSAAIMFCGFISAIFFLF